jgi:hypothetical protein
LGGAEIDGGDFDFGHGVDPGGFEEADGVLGGVESAPDEAAAFEFGGRIASGIPVAQIFAIDDGDILELAVGIVDEVGADLCAVGGAPSGGVEEVELAADLGDLDASDLAGIRIAAAAAAEAEAGELDDAADIEDGAAELEQAAGEDIEGIAGGAVVPGLDQAGVVEGEQG